MLPREETKLRQVYDVIADRGAHGATADEVGEILGWSHQSYSPRVSTLKRDGRIVATWRRRKTRAGNDAEVLVTPEHYRVPKLKGRS